MTIKSNPDQWLPNGFPPPSFVVEIERVSTFSTARGRWLVAAALLGALLLLIGVLLIAQGGDDQTALNTGTSTTLVGNAPIFASSTTTLPATEEGGDPTVPTLPPGDGTTGPTTTSGATTSSSTATTVAPGVLAADPAGVELSTTFAGKPGTATVKVSNTGKGTLAFTSKVSTSLTVAPSSGSIAPGANVTVTISLDGDKLPEGTYNGSVLFEGGGTKTVQVRGKVAKPPTINTASGGKFATAPPGQTPCTAAWSIRANIADSSKVAGVKVRFTTTEPATETGMNKEPTVDADGRGTWVLAQPKVDAGKSVKFVIVARDEFGAEAVTDPAETVTCPAAP